MNIIKRLMMLFSQKIVNKKYRCNSIAMPILLSSTILSSALLGLHNPAESKSITISEPLQVKTFHQEMNIVEGIPEKKETDQGVQEQDYIIQDLVYRESSKSIIETYPLQCGFITTVNVRKAPSLEAEILGIFGINSEVEFYEYSDDWCKISIDGEDAYICKQYISSEPVPYTSFSVSGDERKSFMDYTSITSRNSRQYKIQESRAYTGETGIRMVNERYLIALGSRFSSSVGQYIDLVLENGTVIPCILGDCKADKDTINDHCQGIDGSTAEFIIQTSSLSSDAKQSGDCSDVYDSWDSPVVEIRIYGKNLFD